MAVRPYAFPSTHRATLPNGLRVVVAPMPRLPLVTALALVDAGAVQDPVDAEGLAALVAGTLDEGIDGLDGAALTARFEALGTAFEASADWDSLVARLSVMPVHLDEALALFAQVLRAPSFPAPDVARTRDERLDDLAQQVSEPRGLADQRFTGFLYAPTARFARPLGGNVRSVTAMDAAAVRGFHAARVAPSVTTIILVGDIGVDEALRLVESRFGDWAGQPAPPVPRPADASGVAPRTLVVEKAGAPQSELRLGHVGVPRGHPDHLHIVVMNAILGGLFSSRINLNLRERHAFTYGASSGFDWRRGAGPFVVSTAVKSDVTGRAVEEILRELEAMRAAPPTAAELSLATDYLAGVFPLRYETTAAVAGAIAGAEVYGLSDEWFRAYRDRVQAITAAEVHAAARAHLDPSRLLTLAVGDPDAIRAPLETAVGAAAEQVSAHLDPTEGA